MNQSTKLLMAALTSLSMGAAAQERVVPRGPNVGSLAGSCRIGPFGQTSKAGQYNGLCNVMSDSEKCLALIKGHFNADGSHNSSFQADKLRFCLDTLERELIED